MRSFILLLLLFIVSCHEEPKQFVCGTCEDQKHTAARHPDTLSCNGKELFRAKCASCHNATTKKATGPGLHGVLGRIPGGNWKYEFIRNADSVIKTGDGYAVAIFEEYNKTQHGKFPHITNQEIDAILDYCNASHCR